MKPEQDWSRPGAGLKLTAQACTEGTYLKGCTILKLLYRPVQNWTAMPGLLMEYAEDELLMHSKAAMTYRCGDVMEEDDDLDDPPVQSDPSSEEFQPEEDIDDDENEESECLSEGKRREKVSS